MALIATTAVLIPVDKQRRFDKYEAAFQNSMAILPSSKQPSPLAGQVPEE